MSLIVKSRRSWGAVAAVLVVLIVIVLATVPPARSQTLKAEINQQPPSVLRTAQLNQSLVTTDCRAGVSYVPNFPDSFAWLPTLNAGWFGNFSPFEPVEPNAEFVPQVRVRQVISGEQRLPEYTIFPELGFGFAANGPRLGWFLEQNPGALWVIGNEMEVDNFEQDNIMPDLYAQAYHQIYHFIKGVDPTARVAVGPLSMATPGRLQYLDIVWDTYDQLYGTSIPSDAWLTHLFVLPERTQATPPQYADGKIALGTDPMLAIKDSANNPASCPDPNLPDTPANDPRPDIYCAAEHDSVRIFGEQLLAMRQWMKDHGQQNKPLLLSEFGLLFPYEEGTGASCAGRTDEFGRCFTPQVSADFLAESVAHLYSATDAAVGFPADNNRLVQRWQWYSIYTSFRSGQVSNLLKNNYATFPAGDPAALSVVGQAYIAALVGPEVPNLVGGQGTDVSAFAPAIPGTVDVPIRVTFNNAGDWSVIQPFEVTFYADAALTQVIGTVMVDPATSGVISGCNWLGEEQTAGLTWMNLAVGQYPYWAVIDSGGAIGESSESDNVTAQGLVTVFDADAFANQTYLPVGRGN